MTPEKLDEYRELVKFGRHLGVGGEALRLLLDHIDTLAAELAESQAGRDKLIARDVQSNLRIQVLESELAISKGREEAKQLVINQLEAALRAVMAASFSQDSTYKIAERALTTPETQVSTLCAVCDQIKELHPASHPWTAKPTVETPVQYVCACEIHECHKSRLKSNEYCHDDRKAAGLAQSDQGEKR